jgi:pSer/pThr/pTyr-binding forkhead associated (FHA) protein
MTISSGSLVPVAPEATASLTCWREGGEQRCWPLVGDFVTVGRSPAADVVLDDPLVSRVHARLERVAGRWTVVDDGLSRNGTFVSGRRLAGRCTLRDRDQLRVGDSVLVFCAPADTDATRTLVGEPLLNADLLTPAQRAVLAALCRPCTVSPGWAPPATNQQIADGLFLSIETVKTHLRTVCHRLGIEHLPQNQKRARLVELCLRHGLIPQDDG